MRHCTPDELMDVVEGAPAEVSIRHLAACARCRQQLQELRAVMAEVRDVPVPEPSPVQWARLSARVRDAVASELERSRAPRREGWQGWKSWPGWAWGLPVTAVAILTFALLAPGLNRPAPRVTSFAENAGIATAGGSSAAAVIAQEPAADALGDPSLDLMFDLADGVDLDSDPAPILAMGAGTLDQAVGELSLDEQHEYARLLKESMGRPGA